MMRAVFVRVKALVLAVLTAVSVMISCAQTETPTEHLKGEEECVFFINVGRGDAILIRTGGKYALIDAGSKAHSDDLISALALAGVEKIDALIVTHGNSDHFGGVRPLIEAVEVGTVYYPEFSEKNKNGKNKLEKQIKKLGIDSCAVSCGDVIEIGNVTFDVLGPVEYIEGDENDNSVVLRGEIDGVTYLFTGDMQFAEEAAVIATGASLDCDVLKVPNHGHDDATSDQFAELASPQVSIVTTSTKEDGNTASVTVRDRLRKYGSYHVTEDAETGILVYVENGEIKVLYV